MIDFLHDDWGEFGDDYNALYDRLTAGPISCYPSRVAQEDRAACYDVLVNDWPVEKVISWLAVYNWEEPALSTLLDAVEGSGTLARRTVVEDGATALMAIPTKAFLAKALSSTRAVIVDIDVDEAIALFHLACREAYGVDATPDEVAQEIDAVFLDRSLHLLDVVAQVFDAGVILHGLVLVEPLDHEPVSPAGLRLLHHGEPFS